MCHKNINYASYFIKQPFDNGVHLSRLACTDTGVRYRPEVSGKSCIRLEILFWFGLFFQTVPGAHSVLFDPEGLAVLTQQHSFSRVQTPQRHTHWVRIFFICIIGIKKCLWAWVFTYLYVYNYSTVHPYIQTLMCRDFVMNFPDS